MGGILASINVSDGGLPKVPVFEALVTANGVARDRQHDRERHGGPERAVVLYSVEIIEALQREGHPIAVGAAGENLTFGGLEWAALAPGRELLVGPVHLALSRYANPCYKIAHLFADADFSRISHKTHPGWSRLCARVLEEGLVRPGDPVRLL